MFSPEEIINLKRFSHSIGDDPRPLVGQKTVRDGVFMWCEDWELIEICKYLFNGEEMYLNDPPPNRLKSNPLWSKQDIIKKAQKLIEDFQTADRIIEHLRGIRNGTGA